MWQLWSHPMLLFRPVVQTQWHWAQVHLTTHVDYVSILGLHDSQPNWSAVPDTSVSEAPDKRFNKPWFESQSFLPFHPFCNIWCHDQDTNLSHLSNIAYIEYCDFLVKAFLYSIPSYIKHLKLEPTFNTYMYWLMYYIILQGS